MNRREFVTRLPVVSAGSVRLATGVLTSLGVAATTTACAGLRYARGTEAGDLIRVPRSAFEPGPYLLVETTRVEQPIYLHRDESGEYTAVLARCTHRGCTPDPAGDRLICPCHGSEYTHDGQVLQGPAEDPLPRFQVRATDTDIEVRWRQEGGDR